MSPARTGTKQVHGSARTPRKPLVAPAQAGAQCPWFIPNSKSLDSRLRGNDESLGGDRIAWLGRAELRGEGG